MIIALCRHDHHFSYGEQLVKTAY